MKKTDFPAIEITLVHKGKETIIKAGQGQYLNLMNLISDTLAIYGFGLCCGMQTCGTCLVHIQRKNTALKTSRLACTIPITDDLINAKIIIPDIIY